MFLTVLLLSRNATMIYTSDHFVVFKLRYTNLYFYSSSNIIFFFFDDGVVWHVMNKGMSIQAAAEGIIPAAAVCCANWHWHRCMESA